LFTGALLAQVSIRSLPAQALLPVIIKYAVKPGIEPIRIAQLIDLLQPQGQGLLRQVIGERFVTTPHHASATRNRRGRAPAICFRWLFPRHQRSTNFMP
jgi:hypothetical protein